MTLFNRLTSNIHIKKQLITRLSTKKEENDGRSPLLLVIKAVFLLQNRRRFIYLICIRLNCFGNDVNMLLRFLPMPFFDAFTNAW